MKAIEYLSNPKNGVFEKADRIRKMMEIEELNSHSLDWWVDFGIKYGYEEI